MRPDKGVFLHLCSQWFSSVSANEMSIGLSVKDVQANQATLEWSSSYTHCYDITCSIRNEGSGIKEDIELLGESKTHNISGLTPNTDYTIECIAERSHTRHSEELNFRSGEPNFRFMSQSKSQDCTSVMCRLPQDCCYLHGKPS